MGNRKFLRALGAVLVAFTVALLPATTARAEPTVAEIEAQIEQIWSKLEPVIEQYNNIHSQLLKNRAKSAELTRKIRPLQLQVDLALSQVGNIAAQYYKGGGPSTLNAILTSGSPTTLADQLTLLDQLAKSKQRQIANVTTVKSRYAAEKQKLDELIALQAKQDADLAAKKKLIETEMNRLQRLRIQAYGTSTVGGSLRIGPCPAIYITGKAGTAVKFACSQIGKPYVWGATGPSSYDCSGLTQAAWKQAGVYLTHYTGAQWTEGYAVSRANARPGDLVFFYSDLHHMGMYVGNGLMVHAPRSGDVVRMAYIDRMPIAGFRRPG
ncbi:MAG TPA: NlpC/P60 family protein [Micromonosporaceae bacterium]|nr:NlpC/P60 family protein [Micromonosporaceae bacterium]